MAVAPRRRSEAAINELRDWHKLAAKVRPTLPAMADASEAFTMEEAPTFLGTEVRDALVPFQSSIDGNTGKTGHSRRAAGRSEAGPFKGKYAWFLSPIR